MKQTVKKAAHPSEDLGVFETNIKDERETIEQIALYLWPYGGRVRNRIIEQVKELLDYTETTS